MDRQEAADTLAEIRRRWPDWQPDDSQAEDWIVDVLMPLTNHSRAMNAIRNAWTQAKYLKSPTPKAILTEYKTLSDRAGDAGRQRQGEENPNGYAGCWLQCMEGPRQGMTMRVYFGAAQAIPSDPTRLRKIVEEMRERHQAMYGGTWQIWYEQDAAIAFGVA